MTLEENDRLEKIMRLKFEMYGINVIAIQVFPYATCDYYHIVFDEDYLERAKELIGILGYEYRGFMRLSYENIQITCRVQTIENIRGVVIS